MPVFVYFMAEWCGNCDKIKETLDELSKTYQNKSKFLIVLATWLEKTTYNNSNHIICLSSGMKTELSSIIPKGKMRFSKFR